MQLLIMGLTLLYGAALAGLVWVAHRRKGLYALAKGVCSALFVCCGALAWTPAKAGAAACAAMVGGLVLCAFGDVFLGLANRRAKRVSKKPFLAGAASFSAAHGLFCVYLYLRAAPGWPDLVLPLALCACLPVWEKKGWIRLKKMRPLAYGYACLVGLMAGKAAAVLLASRAIAAGEALFCAGAALFLLSDIVLLFLYFGTRRTRRLRGANLTLYYAGVWLMAAAGFGM